MTNTTGPNQSVIEPNQARKPIAIVISDLHIRDGLRTLPNRKEPSGDIAISLQQVKSYCESLLGRTDLHLPLIVAGDTFDTKVCSSSAIRFATDFFSGWKENVLFVQGQHDESSPPWLQVVRPDAVHLHDRPFSVGGITLVGCDFQYNLEDISALLDRYRDLEPFIFVTHFPFDFVEDSYSIFDSRSNLRLVISGDNHVPYSKILSTGVRFYSPGALCPNRISDTNHFSFLVLYTDSQRNVDVEVVPLITRPVLNVSLSTEEDISTIQVEIEKTGSTVTHPSLSRPLVTVYSSNLDLLVAARFRIGHLCYLFTRPVAETALSKDDSPGISTPVSSDLSVMVRDHFEPPYGEVAALLIEAARSPAQVRQGLLRTAARKLYEIRFPKGGEDAHDNGSISDKHIQI